MVTELKRGIMTISHQIENIKRLELWNVTKWVSGGRYKITKMKNLHVELNWFEMAEKIISKLEVRKTEITQSEEQREKRMNKNEQRLREMGDNFIETVTSIKEVLTWRRLRKCSRKIGEEIRTKTSQIQ